MSVRDLLMSFSSGATNAPVGGCNNTVITANDAVQNDNFGWSVSLSGDGNTALVGAYNKTVNLLTDIGAAYVFSKYNGVWCQE